MIEKSSDDSETRQVANLPVPFAVLVTLCAPWLTVASAGLLFVTGHNARIQRDDA